MLAVETGGAWQLLPLRLSDSWALATSWVGSRSAYLCTARTRALQIASKQVYR